MYLKYQKGHNDFPNSLSKPLRVTVTELIMIGIITNPQYMLY